MCSSKREEPLLTTSCCKMSQSHSSQFMVIIFIVVLHSERPRVLATCVERNDQIQRYLISSAPPYDNYYNISKAVYPSVDLPSMLIKITVTFLASGDNVAQSGSFKYMNISRQNGSISGPSTENFTRTYTWSKACLYVSGGNISMSSMNIFSLFAIYPNRREARLHLTLPEFCKDFSIDNMVYFISTLQDIAVVPGLPDPTLNTAECIIAGHDKASNFSGLKQLLHGVCWSLLAISLVLSLFVSQWLIVQCQEWSKPEKQNKSKIAAVMFLSIILFLGGLISSICALCLSSVHQDFYVRVLSGFIVLVFTRRALWCIIIRYHVDHPARRCMAVFSLATVRWLCCKTFNCDLTTGHDEKTSKNIVSCFILYPAIFMACHHLLWILLGVLTEPFWGITVLVAVVSVTAVLFFLAYSFHKYLPSGKKWTFIMSLILIVAGFFAVVLLMMVFIVVAQAFISESLISVIVQNFLVSVATAWYGHIKYKKKKEDEGEGDEEEDKIEEGGSQTLPLRELENKSTSCMW